jgi:hypothetical protein
LPFASLRIADSVTALFGPPVTAPVYVTDVAFRATAIDPLELEPVYSASAANWTATVWLPAFTAGV